MNNLKKLIKTTLGYVLFFLIFDLVLSFGIRGIVDLVSGHGYQALTYIRRSILDMPGTFVFFFLLSWMDYSYRKRKDKKQSK